ncbi:P-loop NTPase [bacterium]|nr:P-loop NTPase [bacterium]
MPSNKSRENPPKKGGVSKVGVSLLVGSGKGGVGKSTLSANLALALLREGLSVGLLDGDLYGPSQSHLFNLPDGAKGTKEGGILPHQAFGLEIVSLGSIVEKEKALLWRGPVLHRALEQLVTDVIWGELDVLIADLPPGTGDTLLSLHQLLRPAGAILVTTPQETALLDARRAWSAFRKLGCNVLGVVNNMSGTLCPHCGETYPLFPSAISSFLSSTGLRLLGEIPFQPEVALWAESGQPILATDSIGNQGEPWSHLGATVAKEVRSLLAKGKGLNKIGGLHVERS